MADQLLIIVTTSGHSEGFEALTFGMKFQFIQNMQYAFCLKTIKFVYTIVAIGYGTQCGKSTCHI